MNQRATCQLMPLFSPSSSNSSISNSLCCSHAAVVSTSTVGDTADNVDVDEVVMESAIDHHVKCNDDDDHKRNDLHHYNEDDRKQSSQLSNTNTSSIASLPLHSNSSPFPPISSSPTTATTASPVSSSFTTNFKLHRMINVSKSKSVTTSSPPLPSSSSSPSASSTSSSPSSSSMSTSTSPSSSSSTSSSSPYGPTYSVIAPSPPVMVRSCQGVGVPTATNAAATATITTIGAASDSFHQPFPTLQQPHAQANQHYNHKPTAIQNDGVAHPLVTQTVFSPPFTTITTCSPSSSSPSSSSSSSSPAAAAPCSTAAQRGELLADVPSRCSCCVSGRDDCRSAMPPTSSSPSSSFSFSSSFSPQTVNPQMKGPLVDLSNWPLVRDDSVPVAGLEWDTLDLTDALDCQELYDFLANNYIDGEGAAFRYNYSVDMLKWALMPPGYRVEWMVCLRERSESASVPSHSSTSSSLSSSEKWKGECAHGRGRLAGVITAVPQSLRIMSSVVSSVFINFFCMSASYRAGGVVASALIRRLVYFVRTLSPVTTVALYTSGTGSLVIGSPTATTTATASPPTTTTTATPAVSTATFYHRPLNVRKLIHVGFSRRPAGCQTMEQSAAFYSVPADTTLLHAVVPLNESYLQAAAIRFHHYMERFDLAPVYNVDEFRHYFMPRAGVVCTYVMPSPTSPTQVSDLLSFRLLPSRVLRPFHVPPSSSQPSTSTTVTSSSPHSAAMSDYSEIRAAFLTYAIASSVPLSRWLNVGLLLASEEQLDVFNALDCMELDASRILEPIKFRKGTGNLFYHLFNWPHSHPIPKQKLAVLAI